MTAEFSGIERRLDEPSERSIIGTTNMSNHPAIDIDELARFRFRTLSAFAAIAVGFLSHWFIHELLQPVLPMPGIVTYGLVGLPPVLVLVAFHLKRVPITGLLKSLGVSED
jgi:hypothetical protein